MGQTWDFFRSDFSSLHLDSLSWNLIWKSPVFVPFGANLAHFGAKPTIPVSWTGMSRFCLKVGQVFNKSRTYFCSFWLDESNETENWSPKVPNVSHLMQIRFKLRQDLIHLCKKHITKTGMIVFMQNCHIVQCVTNSNGYRFIFAWKYTQCVDTWPSGKLPFGCQKIAKKLTYF